MEKVERESDSPLTQVREMRARLAALGAISNPRIKLRVLRIRQLLSKIEKQYWASPVHDLKQ